MQSKGTKGSRNTLYRDLSSRNDDKSQETIANLESQISPEMRPWMETWREAVKSGVTCDQVDLVIANTTDPAQVAILEKAKKKREMIAAAQDKITTILENRRVKPKENHFDKKITDVAKAS